MKNIIHRVTIAVAALAAAGSAASAQELAPSWRGQPGSIHLVWRFNSGLNPAAPDISTGATQSKAAIVPGQFSIGWKDAITALGTQDTGIWDLGRNGTITLTLGDGTSVTCERVSVLVAQYLDGGIYNDAATVSVTGTTPDFGDLGLTTTGTVGGWFVDQNEWLVAPGSAVDQIRITGAHNGSLIDRVEVDLLTVAPEPALLSIRALAGETRRVEISWPASAGAGQLEWSASLAEPGSWAPVDAPVQSTATGYSVVLEGSEAVRFFRLQR